MIFIKKNSKKYSVRGLRNGSARTNAPAVFPRGSKKRKSTNDDKHDHGHEKGRPTTLSWGKTIKNDPSARPQTRDLFEIESKPLLPGSGSQDLAAKMW